MWSARGAKGQVFWLSFFWEGGFISGAGLQWTMDVFMFSATKKRERRGSETVIVGYLDRGVCFDDSFGLERGMTRGL